MTAYCCVSECENNAETKKDTFFHTFPSNPELKAKWLKVIDRTDWEPPEEARICSDHFSIFQLKKNFEGSLVEVCRICLATDDDVALYSLQYGKLKLYMDTFFTISNNFQIEGLPEFVCYECAVHLRKCYNMIKKCETSLTILHAIFAENGELIKSLVKISDRENLGLKTSLEPHNITPTYLFDYEYNYDDDVSYLTNIDFIHDPNENKIEWDSKSDSTPMQCDTKSDSTPIQSDTKFDLTPIQRNIKSDSTPIQSDCKDDIYFIEYLEEEENSVKSDSDNVHDEDETNAEEIEENSVFNIKNEINNAALSERNNNVNAENDNGIRTRSMKEIKQKNSKVPAKSERRGFATVGKFFNIVKLMTLQEKRDEWRKSMENPFWVKPGTSGVYKCEVCCKLFANPKTYGQHRVLHDPDYGNAECPVCKTRHKDDKTARLHMKTVHSKKYYCKSCPRVFCSLKAAENHHFFHMGHVYKCERCPYSTRHKSSLNHHMRDAHSHAFACELCGRVCVSSHGLQVHHSRQHRAQLVDNNEYPCERCNFSFTTEEALREHLLTSAQHKNLKRKSVSLKNTCCFCGREFSSLSELRKHKKSNHKSDNGTINLMTGFPRACKHCEEVLQTYDDYYIHMRQQHPEIRYQPFVCDVCGNEYQSDASLRSHKLRHSSPKFECCMCARLFYDKTTLEVHMNGVHSEERPHACPICQKAFKSKGNYYRHVKLHTAVSQECSSCGKLFKNEGSLKYHFSTVHLKIVYPSLINRKRTRKPTQKRTRVTIIDT